MLLYLLSSDHKYFWNNYLLFNWFRNSDNY